MRLRIMHGQWLTLDVPMDYGNAWYLISEYGYGNGGVLDTLVHLKQWILEQL